MNGARDRAASPTLWGWIGLLVLAGCLLGSPVACWSAPQDVPQSEPQHILFLYSYGYGSKGVEVFNESYRNTMTDAGVSVTNIFSEYLDLERNKADPQYRARLLDMLRRKYADKHIDLIITGQQPALGFLLNEGRDLAVGVPAITTLAPLPTPSEAGERRIVGYASSFDMKGTMERAMELFPETQRIVFASGSSEADVRLANAAAASAAAWKGKVDFEFTYELSLDQLLARVGTLPPNTIIVFTQFNRDKHRRVGVAYEVERMIVKAANAPVFGFWDFNLYNGGIGGSVLGVRKLGQSTAELALDMLRGKFKPDQQITVIKSEPFPMFDWGQVKKWGGDPARLPANTVFVNRVPTFWEQYKVYVVALIVFVLAQSFLIVLLLLSRRRRVKAESLLRQSQQTNQEIIDGIPSLIYGLDTDGRFIFANRAFYQLFQVDPAHLLHHTRETLGMPKQIEGDHRSNDLTVMRNGQPIEVEERKSEGDRDHFYLTQKFPLRDPDGKIGGVCGISTDITELKQSHLLTESLLKTIPFAMNIVDNDGTVLYMNEKMQQALGRQGQGERCWSLYRDDGRQCDQCPLYHGVTVGHTAAIESRGVFGGRIFEIQHTGMIYQGRDAVMEIFLDVTDRKRAEEETVLRNRELKDLYAALQNAREEERRRLARELHDDLGQRATALRMDLDAIDAKLPATNPSLSAKMENVGRQIDGLTDALRRLIEDMRPGLLDALGLVAAVEDYIEKFVLRTGVKCDLETNDREIRVDDQIGISLFRIIQESLNNVQKYAHASRVWISLYQSNEEIALVVADDGVGLPDSADQGRPGLGLRGISERVSILNGRVSITSARDQGVRIEVVIPLPD